MSYVLIVLWEVRHRLVGYQLVLSDWLWYTLLPLISYTALVVAAILLPIFPGPVLFIIAAVTMLLLFTGIHNAHLHYVVTQQTFLYQRPHVRMVKTLANGEQGNDGTESTQRRSQ